MRNKPIIVYGDTQPWDQRRELLLAYPITNGFAQLATPPFATFWTGMGDIVVYDKRRRISRVVIQNSRTIFGKYGIKGLNANQIGRKSERLGKFLSSHSISTLFINRFPGIFSMSVMNQIPQDRMIVIARKSPVQFRLLRNNELQNIINNKTSV